MSHAEWPTPPIVHGVLANATQVAAGFSHDLVLLDDGTVLGWGTNNNGNLGNNQPGVSSATPVQVSGLSSGSGVMAITAGPNFSFALKSDGTVLAGNNGQGQLGDGSITSRSTPIQVVCRIGDAMPSSFCSNTGSLRGVSALAAGSAIAFAVLRMRTTRRSDYSELRWVRDGFTKR